MHRDLHLEVREHGGAVVIDSVFVQARSRGRGIATRAVAEICRDADARQMPVRLKPDDGFGVMALPDLVRWYSSLGFIPDRGEPGWMIRRPRRPA